MSGTSITPGSSSAGRDERQRIVDQTGQRSEPLDPAKASSSSNLGRFKALALAEGKKRIEQQRSDELLSSDAIIGTFAEALRSAVEDRHREVVAPWYILMPDHPVKRAWDLCLIGLLLNTVIVLPIRVAFHPDDPESTLDIVIDFLYLADLLLTFFTAYEGADGDLIVSLKRIATRYLTGWFLIDLLASLPYSLILPPNGAFSAIGAISQGLKFPRLTLRVLRMAKTLRARRAQRMFYDLEYNPLVHQGVVRGLKLFIMLLGAAHLSACIWYRVGYEADPDQSWLDRSFNGEILSQPQTYQYLVSLYWAWQTLCTLGYGDVSGHSTGELVVAVVAFTTGAIIISYVTATVSSILETADKHSAAYRERMHLVSQFLSHKSLPRSLQTRVVRELGLLYKRDHREPVDQSLVLADMTPDLRREVIEHLYAELIAKSEFFKLVGNPNLETDVLSVGETVRVRPGQYIATYGYPCDAWYLVVKGQVAAVSSGNSSIVYQKFLTGASVGEIGMFLTNSWVYSLRSLGESTLLKVPIETMLRIIGTYEGITNTLLEKAEADLSNLVHVKRSHQGQDQSFVRMPARPSRDPAQRRSEKWDLGRSGRDSRESGRDDASASSTRSGTTSIERLDALEAAVRAALQQVARLRATSCRPTAPTDPAAADTRLAM
ncbi:Cyclic nucleotide-binding domain-containing protein [Plasmodiophora brassicae]